MDSLWSHIEDKGLPQEGGGITLDMSLRSLLQRSRVTLPKLKEVVAQHMNVAMPLNSSKDLNELLDEVSGPAKRRSATRTTLRREKQLSNELAAVVGVFYLTRGEVVRSLWRYIKEHKLQDPKDGRYILCDALLERLFGTARVSMFKMNAMLQRHMFDPEEVVPQEEAASGTASSARKRKRSSAASKSSVGSAKTKKEKSQSKPSKSQSRSQSQSRSRSKTPLLSDTLAAFIGEKEMSRPQVVKRLWEYIREKELQNPKDKRQILCDSTLQAIFGRKRVTMFSMNKFLSPHFRAPYEEEEEEEEEEGEEGEEEEEEEESGEDSSSSVEAPASKRQRVSSNDIKSES